MEITPDQLVVFRWGFVVLNATIVYTWGVMALMVLAAWIATRKVRPGAPPSRLWSVMEGTVSVIRGQIQEVSGGGGGDEYLPFVGTLFLFIAISNVLDVVPGWHAPTGSLSTTAALAICVAVSVPLYGIRSEGLRGYLHHYVNPAFFMVPFHLTSEISRTLALAVRLFGNIMSGSMIAAMLLALAPLFVPVLMQALGLLIGLIQAYIFAILAMVYIAAAVRRQEQSPAGAAAMNREQRHG